VGITLLRTGYSDRPGQGYLEPQDNASIRDFRLSATVNFLPPVSVPNRYQSKETYNKADSRLYHGVTHENGTAHSGVGVDVAAHVCQTVAIRFHSALPVSSVHRRTATRAPTLGAGRTPAGGRVMTDCIRTGVVGVGSMGRHHARVYSELPTVDLVGVCDSNKERAREVADQFDTRAMDRGELLSRADGVSIAVPTRFHEAVGRAAIQAGTHVLIEKPFVDDPDVGRELLSDARDRDLVVQVGHIERYNPAVIALQDVMLEVDPIAFAARRQGPPVDRDTVDSVVYDLMIHDIDVVCSLADEPVTDVSAVGAAGGDHVVAHLEFADGLVASLTASRVTQERVRDLAVTAEDCHVDVDYMDQSVQIHRHSLPEYVATNGDVRYRHESVIERPTVETGEPLKNELSSFVDAVRNGEEPKTTGEDGVHAVELARRVEAAVNDSEQTVSETPNL